DATRGKELRTIALPLRPGSVSRLIFSPDSKVLAVPIFNRKTIAVIDVVTGEPRTWKHDFGASPVLVFGRDSTKLYGWSNFMKRIDKGEQKPTYEHHKTVVEWDARTGKELRTLDWKAPGGIRSEGTVPASARLSADGKTLVAAGLDNALGFFDLAAFEWFDTGSDRALSLSAIHFTPDGKHLFSLDKGKILKWDTVTAQQTIIDAPPLV